MARTVTWNLNLDEVEEGQYVELTAEGLGAFEYLDVLIGTPNCTSLTWRTRADANGRVRESIKLDSGQGIYEFRLSPDCGPYAPPVRHVNVCPCNVRATDCNIQVIGSPQIIVGQKAIFRFTGLKPLWALHVRILSNQETTSSVNAKSTPDGTFEYELEWNQAGTYAIQVTDGYCISPPFIFDAVYPHNNFPGIKPIGSNLCAQPVDVTVQFNKDRYQKGEAGNCKVTICNRGDAPRTLNIWTTLELGDASLLSNDIPGTLSIAPHKCREFIVGFSAGDVDEVYSLDIEATYVCSGDAYVANGGSGFALVGVGEGVCSTVLQFFGPTDPTASQETDTDRELEVILYNAGSATVQTAEILQLNLDNDLTLVETLPLTGGPIAPGDSISIKLNVTSSVSGNYSVSLPSGGIEYLCGMDRVELMAPGFYTAVFTDPE